jgi:hypothetical protein
MTSLSNFAGDGAAESTLVMARHHYRVLLAMALPSRHWPWHDVVAESCWRWHCQVVIRRGVTLLPSLTGDGIAESTLAMA